MPHLPGVTRSRIPGQGLDVALATCIGAAAPHLLQAMAPLNLDAPLPTAPHPS